MRKIPWAGSVLTIIAAATASTLAQSPFITDVRLSKGAFSGQESITLHFSLVNPGIKDLQVLSWDLPSDNPGADLFEVTRGGARVPYLGELVKRGAPKEEDYVYLRRGGRIDLVVELQDQYDFGGKGEYDIRFRKRVKYRDISRRAYTFDEGKEPELAFETESPSRKLLLTSDRPARRKDAALFKGSVQYTGCSEAQTFAIEGAWETAISMARNSQLSISQTPVTSRNTAQRYLRWFGTYDAARYTRVSNNYTAIFNALNTQNVHFDCSTCPSGPHASAYAYVQPTTGEPWRVFLCNSFWSAPLTGTDSQAGTLIHEFSHFDALANTDDHAYGHTNCVNLATNNPGQAVANGDSHEYFSENTPYVSMPVEGAAIASLPAIIAF